MSEEDDTVRRRCRCESCGRHFTTYERIELFFPAVAEKSGSHVNYDRNKVKDSIRLVPRKRPVSTETIDETIARIKEKLLDRGEKEIGNDRVGELVTRELERLDKIRYIRFASMYRSFEGLAKFRDVLDEVTATSVRK